MIIKYLLFAKKFVIMVIYCDPIVCRDNNNKFKKIVLNLFISLSAIVHAYMDFGHI